MAPASGRSSRARTTRHTRSSPRGFKAWVVPKTAGRLPHGQTGRSEVAPGEPFAVGRGRIGNDSMDDARPMQRGDGRSPGTDTPAAAQARPRIPRPAPFAPSGEMKQEGPAQAAPDDFPLPFALTGKKPNLTPPKAAAGPGTQSAPTPPLAGAIGTRKPGAAVDSPKPGDPKATAKKKAKPVTIDPSLLELRPAKPQQQSLRPT